MSEAITAIPAERRIVLDAEIATQITHMPFWSDADTLFTYAALDDEVDVQPVLRTAEREGKAIALPRIDPESRRMSFRAVGNFPTEMERHPFGFLQPRARQPTIEPDARSVMLVPGRAFDRRGYRVGRGGGFYDRFLAQAGDGAVTVGVAYSVQLVPEVPRDESDLPVQVVVTESETCFCRRLGVAFK